MRSCSRHARRLGGAGLVATTQLILVMAGVPVPAGATPIQRPSPTFVEPPLAGAYGPPLTVDGQVASLEPLEPSVTAAALSDYGRLHYLEASDLGGFVPAPPGRFLVLTPGRTLGANGTVPEIPLYAEAGNGQVSAFAFVPGSPANTKPVVPQPDNGTAPPGGGAAPGGNGGGQPGNGGAATGGDLPTPTNRPTPTTTPPGPPPTPPPSTTTTTTPGPQFIALNNDHNGNSLINAVNMAPGSSASALVVLTNVGTLPFTLYVAPQNASGQLASVMSLTVSAASSGQVFYSGPLTGPQSSVTYLSPGASIECRVTMTLSRTAGNSLQGRSASVDLVWGAA